MTDSLSVLCSKAIRAGAIDIKEPYRFALPPTWHEGKVANIQSGNFCMPRCDEPWTEVVFEAPSEGKVTVSHQAVIKLSSSYHLLSKVVLHKLTWNGTNLIIFMYCTAADGGPPEALGSNQADSH